MTLLELLVAMVIGSLVIALVVRGLGLSLGLYERVSRITGSLDTEFRQRAWWVDSVAGLAPCTDVAHCVRGTAEAFEGYTLAGIVHPGGQRVPVRWALVPDGRDLALTVTEGSAEQTEPLVIRRGVPRGTRFVYQGPEGSWHSDWNTDGEQVRLPEAVRLETGGGLTLSYASTAMRPIGKIDYRDALEMQ